MPIVYRNFKAWIYCDDDGDILEEYKAAPDPEDEKVYTCWVPSEAGKRFAVHWESLMKAECDNRGVTFVDGVETHSYVNIATSGKDGASSGVKLSTGEIRPYSFSNVTLTDDDTYLDVQQSVNSEELGNITLKIYLVHAHLQPVSKSQQRRHRPRSVREVNLYDGAIHEKTKKICDHRITLGDAIPFGPPRGSRPRSKKLVWEPIDRDDPNPHVIFRFKYRPRAYLQAQGIIPPSTERTPSKPTIADVGAVNVDIEDESKKGIKRKKPLEEQGTSQRNIKCERACSNVPLFLPTPSLLRETPGANSGAKAEDIRPMFFETPRPMEDDDDDVVVVGYSQGGVWTQTKALTEKKPEPISAAPVKSEGGGMLLYMNNQGVIDLTLDD